MKSSTLAVIVVIIVAVVGLGWWYYAKAPTSTPVDQSQTTGTTQTTNPTSGTDAGQPDTGVTGTVGVTVGVPKTVTVSYNGSTFSPATIAINAGDTVNFVTTGGAKMWLASDPHPTHTGYDGTSRSTHCAAGYTGPKPLDECSLGTSFSFTFTKAGSFGYHDHFNDGAHGTVIVQ